MNEVLSDEDVARRYAHCNAGYRLLSYHPAAIRVYRLLVRVLKMVRSELPLLDEFIMKCIDAGVTSYDAIAGFLGLDIQIIQRVCSGLQNAGHVYLGASGATRSHTLLLTPKGTEVLRKRQIDFPVEDDVWVEVDGLTGEVSMSAPWRQNEISAKKDGFVIIDPLPKLTPGLEQIRHDRKIHHAWNDQRYRLIAVLEVVKREPCFRDDGLILAFVAANNAIRYELVVDSVLSEKHSQAFRMRLANRPDPRFPMIKAGDITDEQMPDGLLDETLTNQVEFLSEEQAKIEHQAEEISERIRDTSDSETIQRLTEELEAIQSERDRLAHQMSTETVRHLTVFDHPKYLQDALEQCQERLMIISPWITPKVVDNRFIKKLEQALQRGVHVYIGYGINDDTDERNSNEAVSDLDRLARRNKNFQLVHLGDTHAKVLICDAKFVITGSFNWLSFKGNPYWKPRDEQSWYIGIPNKIEEQFRYNLERLEAISKRD